MNHSYDIVNDLVNEKPVQAIEMFPNLSESKSSSLPLNSTIEDIHDCSENEEDTPNKTSMENVLYEPGRCTKFNLQYSLISEYIHNYTHGHRIIHYSNSLLHTHHPVTTHTIVTHIHAHVHTHSFSTQGPRFSARGPCHCGGTSHTTCEFHRYP